MIADTLPDREYQFGGSTISCQLDAEAPATQALQDRIPEEAMCQHIGPFQLGLPFGEQTEPLGTPARRVVDTDSQRLYLYRLKPASDKPPPYLLLGGVGDTLTLIQLTGSKIDPLYDWDFSSVELGVPEDSITAVFGPLRQTKDVEDMDGVKLWSYLPHQISLEIRDEKLFSIRIWLKGRAPQL
ncbi:hypothetical protein CRI94_14235 [Longibacter salinarum]|uniref:Uncharacterized protein n=1 Tax=Longibacter salinarum TaxID=1850348 RepID=A0A2A8CW95_9BACT|nr:hypothetical protein [Longibacter salinarum]PEN12668.1 hypothetical protein CRI94_14235 [Longibacter salinarum]